MPVMCVTLSGGKSTCASQRVAFSSVKLIADKPCNGFKFLTLYFKSLSNAKKKKKTTGTFIFFIRTLI